MLPHNYLFVLVGLKFVRVVQLDTYYAMISDVEHHAVMSDTPGQDTGPASHSIVLTLPINHNNYF